MKVRLMQRVDYWVGVPLCFLFSIIHRIARLVLGSKEVTPKNLLFIELSEMGSAILAYSSLVKARQAIGAENIYFLVFKRNRESVELLNLLPQENIIVISDNSFLRFAFSAIAALFRIRKLGIDTVIDLELFSRFTALFSYMTGAPIRVGFHNYTAEGLYRGSFLTHRVFYNPHQHMSLNFLALVFSLQAPKNELPLLKRNVAGELVELPKFQPTAQEAEYVWSALRAAKPDLTANTPLIVLNPDPGDALPIRGWPLDKFVQLSCHLVDRNPDAILVIIGLERMKVYANAIMSAVGKERCINLTGKTRTLRDVVSLFDISKVLVTNDSGPAHFASLSSIQAVALFGPETPVLYGPLGSGVTSIYANYSCSPCVSAHNHRRTCCTDNKCLQVIEVVEVLAAVERALGSSSTVSPYNADAANRRRSLTVVNS
jgi:ADP-heptose:LPS heptosyltransferase